MVRDWHSHYFSTDSDSRCKAKEYNMVTAIDKLKASLKSQFGDISAMSPSEIPNKGVVSTGSLGIDYMVGSKHGMGVPRNIVVELGGMPGSSKSSLSFSIIEHVLELEFYRACFKRKVEKLVSQGKFEKGELDWFNKFYDEQIADLHVWNEQEKNDAVDAETLTDEEKQSVIENDMRNGIYLDVEGRFDKEWASHFIKEEFFNKLILVWPDTAEQATDMYVEALRTGTIAVAVFDSIGGAPSQRTYWKSATSGNVGGNALAITRFSQFAQNMSNKYTCLTIGINQVRADMSGYHQYITPGGLGWQHACSLRIELKRKNKDVVYDIEPGTVDSQYICGYKVAARLHKNSIGMSKQACEFWFYTNDCRYGKAGFGTIEELINLATLCGEVEKGAAGVYRSGYFPDGKIRGYDKMVNYIKNDEGVYNQLYEDMKSRLMSGDIRNAVTEFNDADEE